MKKPILIGTLAFIVILAVFSVWFWSLGAIAPGVAPLIRVDVVSGKVEHNKGGSSEWKVLTASQPIAVSDAIRVGEDGEARIYWGDRGVTRLESKTQIVVEAMPDATSLTNASLKLHVASGRTWNRMLKLLDLQSVTEVRTDTVVATVRGTSFGVAAVEGGMETAVTDSVVDIHTSSGTASTLVREGRWGRFANDGTPEFLRDITDQDTWPQQNIVKDRVFNEEFRRVAQDRLKKQAGHGPRWLAALSEELHLSTVSGERNADLAAVYATRRLEAALSGHGEEVQTENFRRLIELSKSSPKAWQGYLARLRDALAVVDVTTDEGRNMREVLWGVREYSLGSSTAERRYALALNIDDRIDDVVLYPADPVIDRGRADGLLIEVDAWQAGSRDGVSSDEANRLAAKAAAMRERLRAIGQKLPESVKPVESTDNATSTAPVIPTTPPSTTRPVPTGTTPPVPTTPIPAPIVCSSARVTLFMKPTTISLSQTSSLSLLKSCADGKTEDVTAKSVFNGNDLTIVDIRGSMVYPKKNGRVTITGSVTVDGRVLSATGLLTIADSTNGLSLTSIRVTTPGSTSITTAQRAPLEATAVYSDGSTKTVTYQCRWTTSDARMAIMNGNVFQHLQGYGTVSAICAYTENSVTANGTLLFTVSLDPSLQPGGSGSGTKKNPFTGASFAP